MASYHGPVVQSALLRSELVRLRRERGLTQAQVAAGLAWLPAKLIRAEDGHSPVSQADLDALLQQYGITSDSQRERLHDLNRGAQVPGWWEAYRGHVAAAYLDGLRQIAVLDDARGGVLQRPERRDQPALQR